MPYYAGQRSIDGRTPDSKLPSPNFVPERRLMYRFFSFADSHYSLGIVALGIARSMLVDIAVNLQLALFLFKLH